MSLAQEHHNDSAKVCDWRRQEEAAKLAALGALREAFLLEASIFANRVAALDPSLIDRWELATRSQTQSIAEAVTGFVERVTDCVSDLIDADQVRQLQNISEFGSDDQ